MSKDDKRENFKPDPTATRDIGGAYGGSAGTMAGTDTEPNDDSTQAQRLERSGTDVREQTAVGGRTGTSSDPTRGTSVPAGDAPAYRTAGGRNSGSHPMSRTDAADTSTAQTDHREEAQSPDRGLGQDWTGESAPDQEFRDNPPTRRSGEGKDTAANDAF
jgi:hypothetical protein